MYTLSSYDYPTFRRSVPHQHSFDFFDTTATPSSSSASASASTSSVVADLEQLYERYHSLEQQRQEAAAAIVREHQRQQLLRQRQRRQLEQEAAARAVLQRRAQLLRREAEEQQFKEALLQGINEALERALLSSQSSENKTAAAPTTSETKARAESKTVKPKTSQVPREIKRSISSEETSKQETAVSSPASAPVKLQESQANAVKMAPFSSWSSSTSTSIPVRVVRSEANPLKIATTRTASSSSATPASTPTPSSGVSVEDEKVKNFNLDPEDFVLAQRVHTPQPLSPSSTMAKNETEKVEPAVVHDTIKSDRVVAETA